MQFFRGIKDGVNLMGNNHLLGWLESWLFAPVCKITMSLTCSAQTIYCLIILQIFCIKDKKWKIADCITIFCQNYLDLNFLKLVLVYLPFKLEIYAVMRKPNELLITVSTYISLTNLVLCVINLMMAVIINIKC